MNTDQKIDLITQARKCNDNILSVGEIFRKLEKHEDNRPIYLTNGHYLKGEFHSYRGYYWELCLDLEQEDAEHKIDTVHWVRQTLKKALDAGEMTGYKGGEFEITNSTSVWVGRKGTTEDSAMIVDVLEFDGELFLVVQSDGDDD